MNHTITVTCDCGWTFRDAHDCPNRVIPLEAIEVRNWGGQVVATYPSEFADTRAERLYLDPMDDAPENERDD